MSGWQDDAQRDLIKNVGPRMELLTRGEGAHVWDGDGRRYLDFLAGIAVNSLGHAHPVFVEAISRQAATLVHISNYFASPPQLALAARLKRLAGTGEEGRVYFSNSGAEANEAAFKLARLHGGAARPRIIALDNAFHGRTMGSLAMTAKLAMREPFLPMPGGVEHIPATIEALEAAIDDSVAAVIVEPIQGEAGVVELPEGYLAAARALTTKHGALLIIDEIQTGAGRTGAWFGYQHEGIVPDAITLAKGIGGGFPIGAIVTYGAASQLFTPGSHGSTYGGNPLGTAVADAVLGEIENAGLVENAALRGAQVRTVIEEVGSPLVVGVRGRGLLIGVALAAPVAGEIVAAAQRLGLIVNAANPSTVRIAPPLNIGDAEIAEFRTLFAAALAEVEASTPAAAASSTGATTADSGKVPA
ncbi:acetylornithine aminotransferase [Microbacterium keratanolyticum]|uniref:Acetylornithine aminotransferase n=1 Tax=Microbacterium keratanolyticum TaxID=67574 RepID=A0A9W6HU40_9MICO|nr:acetylornithine transaminase [Microbacterium keratanolyticum]MBM7469992.1 acetylornithine aminotransferase [Microbacterium keratanolyticum]GLK02071.1 acetylornithine aminotransferase [Microbacterium keratanolyticum]